MSSSLVYFSYDPSINMGGALQTVSSKAQITNFPHHWHWQCAIPRDPCVAMMIPRLASFRSQIWVLAERRWRMRTAWRRRVGRCSRKRGFEGFDSAVFIGESLAWVFDLYLLHWGIGIRNGYRWIFVGRLLLALSIHRNLPRISTQSLTHI